MTVFCHVLNKDILLSYRSNLVFGFFPEEIQEAQSHDTELVVLERFIDDCKAMRGEEKTLLRQGYAYQ